MKKPNYTIVGKKFGHLTVTGYSGRGYWVCECECGNVRLRKPHELTSGKFRSCGCQHYASQTTHGLTRSREWRIYYNMRARCCNPNDDRYQDYGGRGIRVCDRWLGCGGFIRFVEDMGRCPSAKHSIDRVDNDGPYSPDNCQWSDDHKQKRNMRNNVFITMSGETLCLSDWSAKLGINKNTIRYRLRAGWPVERVLAT